MGRRAGSLRAAISVCRIGRTRQVRAYAVWIIGLVFVVSLVAPRASAATRAKGSRSRADRNEAMRDIPYDRLTPAARQKISAVVDNHSLYRRMPTNVIDCDPRIYRFLVRYPEVVVNIWQLMGITKVTVDRVASYSLNAKDGVGTVTNIELVYGDQDTHLMYCEGHYDGPLFRRPLTGRCVLLLKSDYEKTAGDRWNISNRMDVFLQIDNVAVEALSRTLHPLFGRSADLNFVQSTAFLERISRTSKENSAGMYRLAQRLDAVRPSVREQFALLTQPQGRQATEKVAQHINQVDSRAGSTK
jgi:hypothetical protein